MLLSVHAKPFEKLKLSKYFSLYTKTDELIYFCRIQQRFSWLQGSSIQDGKASQITNSRHYKKHYVMGTSQTKMQSLFTSQFDVSFSCACPVIDNEFRHNIAKKVNRSTRLSPRRSTATLKMLWRISGSITGQTHEKLRSIS